MTSKSKSEENSKLIHNIYLNLSKALGYSTDEVGKKYLYGNDNEILEKTREMSELIVNLKYFGGEGNPKRG